MGPESIRDQQSPDRQEPSKGQPLRNLNRVPESAAPLLLNISNALLRADLDTLDAEIDRSLQLVGRELGVDAMSVCMVEQNRLVNRAHWRATNGWIEPPLDIDLTQAQWLRGQLDGSADVVADRLADIPSTEARHELRVFAARKVASLIAAALPGPDGAQGYLFVEVLEQERAWERDHVAIIRMLATSLGAAWDQRRHALAVIDRERRALTGERRQNQLLTMFAHELRAPLTAIIGYAEMIKELSSGPDGKKQKQYVGDLLDKAHHMSTFISDTLSLARIDGGEVSLMLTRFDIVDVLRSATRQVIPRAKNLAIELETSVPDETHYVFGDRNKLTQLVTNLLDNALKFTPQSGKVALALTIRDDDYDIEVADTGVGIGERDQQRIFRSFEQLASAAQHDSEPGVSIGLGLTLVKRLAELHEGDVFVNSTPNRGSSFRVTLKRRPTPPAPGSAKVRSFFD